MGWSMTGTLSTVCRLFSTIVSLAQEEGLLQPRSRVLTYLFILCYDCEIICDYTVCVVGLCGSALCDCACLHSHIARYHRIKVVSMTV